MKRLLVYLIPMVMLVALFQLAPSQVIAEITPELPEVSILELEWDDSIEQASISYFVDTSTMNPVDLQFDCMLKTMNTNGTARGTIKTSSVRTWTSQNADEPLFFYETSTTNSYHRITWAAAATYGEARFDLQVDEDQR